jgi:hypothetical protein
MIERDPKAEDAMNQDHLLTQPRIQRKVYVLMPNYETSESPNRGPDKPTDPPSEGGEDEPSSVTRAAIPS